MQQALALVLCRVETPHDQPFVPSQLRTQSNGSEPNAAGSIPYAVYSCVERYCRLAILRPVAFVLHSPWLPVQLTW